MKGVILTINPNAQIVDITHDIPAQDIEDGAFTLLASHHSFPVNTIHVGVVDPGVGSTRRPILITAARQFFIGPDNGLFSFILDVHSSHKAYHLTNDRYFRRPVSPSFHGRDVFAPVAAALSKGLAPSRLGRRIKDAVRLPGLTAKRDDDGKVVGRIVHIDHFGNCVTNITRAELNEHKESAVTLVVDGKRISALREFFADDRSKEKLFMIWGSAGFLEIASRNQSAARLLQVKRGAPVTLQIHS